MNKFAALVLAAFVFVAVSAQDNTYTNGTGTTGTPCRANTDCNQTQSFCCAATTAGGSLTGSYTTFNCGRHTDGSTTLGKCISNATNDFMEFCEGQAKICTSLDSRGTYCGGKVAMAAVNLLPKIECVSSGRSLMISVAFFAMVALSFVF
jgi:hypothetical protein